MANDSQERIGEIEDIDRVLKKYLSAQDCDRISSLLDKDQLAEAIKAIMNFQVQDSNVRIREIISGFFARVLGIEEGIALQLTERVLTLHQNGYRLMALQSLREEILQTAGLQERDDNLFTRFLETFGYGQGSVQLVQEWKQIARDRREIGEEQRKKFIDRMRQLKLTAT